MGQTRSQNFHSFLCDFIDESVTKNTPNELPYYIKGHHRLSVASLIPAKIRVLQKKRQLKCLVKPQSHRACDKSCDWSYKSWVIVRANLVAARSMVMFKTHDPRLQITRGRKQVVHARATNCAGSFHQSHMIVGWQVTRLDWRLTGRPYDWSCHL